MKQERTLAAVLIDFENIFYGLKPRVSEREEVTDVIVKMVQSLREHLNHAYQEQAISLDAYADFDRIEENAQSALYLLGVETHNVLGTEHKNAADMRLCIDAMELLYTRPDITTFVVMAGDRDYIPVIQHLKKKGRTVRVAGFRENVSGDLLTNVGEEYFLDANQFAVIAPQLAATPAAAGAGGTAVAPGKPAAPSPFLAPRPLDGMEKTALEIMFKYFGGKREVWMVPYLHKLRTELPELTEPERKLLISQLAESGAIKVERRQGVTHEYSVILVNWNHLDVRAMHPGS